MLSLKSATRQLFATANVAQKRKTQTAITLYRRSLLRLGPQLNQLIVIPRSASNEESRFFSPPRRTQIPRFARDDNSGGNSGDGALCIRGVASNASTGTLVVSGMTFRISPLPARGPLLPLRRIAAPGNRTFPPKYSSEKIEFWYSDRVPRRCSNGGRSESCPQSG